MAPRPVSVFAPLDRHVPTAAAATRGLWCGADSELHVCCAAPRHGRCNLSGAEGGVGNVTDGVLRVKAGRPRRRPPWHIASPRADKGLRTDMGIAQTRAKAHTNRHNHNRHRRQCRLWCGHGGDTRSDSHTTVKDTSRWRAPTQTQYSHSWRHTHTHTQQVQS